MTTRENLTESSQQWGGLMQDDVTDGVKAMIDQHLVDPKRVCIVGWSYGGYAALAGAAFTPELYTCAASINGVFDLPLIQAWELKFTGQLSDSVAYWREHMGPMLDPKLAAASPNRHVGRIRANVLLLQSTDDTVVPADQTELMANALKGANKPVKWVRIPGDDHWLSNSATRVQALKELDTFLRENLPP